MTQSQQLRKLAARSATAFLLAALCVFPLYIDKFSNLGVVKFTGVATLSWAFCLWLGALAAIGARPRAGRLPWRTDHGLWALGAVVATSVMNILLDLALVGPFGVAGAAAATAAAQVAGAVYMVAFLRRTQMDAAFSPRMLKARYARDIFRLSAPNSVQQASGTIITTVKQGLLGGLGVEAIAGFSCAGKLSSLLMMPVFGFVQSTVFFIAQNTAALQPGRVKEGLREGRRILLVYSLGVVAVCIGLRGPLLRLFTTDPAAASYGCTMLAFESVTYLFVAQKHLFEARLRGAQKMGLYLASSLGQIALNLLACVILVPRIGFAGFWMSSWISAPIGMLLAAALANLSGASRQLP